APARSPQPAADLVVPHAPLPLRLHLLGDERAVLEPRAPDDHAAAVEFGPGADVRRESAYPPPGVDRVRQVELAVPGRDLLGVRDAVLALRLEPGVGQHVAEGPRGDLRRAGEDRAGVVVGPDREGLLRRDRAGVERLDRAVDRDARLLVAGEDRPLHWRRSAPAREERRMDVQP